MNENQFSIIVSNLMKPESPLQVGNSPGYFYTFLPEKLNLTSDYEVGLAEISLDHSWFNVQHEESISLETKSQSVLNQQEVEIKPGYYTDIKHLLDELNNAMKRIRSVDGALITKHPEFILSEKDKNKIILKLGSYANFGSNAFETCVPKISLKLGKLLGMNTDCLFNLYENFKLLEENTIEFPEDYDLFTIKSIDIFCDIVTPSISGNQLKSVIASIQVPRENNSNRIFMKFDEIYFHNLKYFEIDHILVYMNDQCGNEIKFNHSSVTNATLQFRKKFQNV
jgi:hypothetical protein